MSLESINKLSELTGRTSRTIKSRLKNLAPVRQGKGRAHLYESTEALPLIFDLGEGAAPQRAQTRLASLRGDEIDHRLSLAQGDVANIEILTWTLQKIAGLINSVLGSLPIRLKKRCPKLTARDIEDLRRIIVKLQNEISEIQL